MPTIIQHICQNSMFNIVNVYMSFTAILVLIEYYGYFMLGEVKVFLWIFINDSHIKCMSAQDRGKEIERSSMGEEEWQIVCLQN